MRGLVCGGRHYERLFAVMDDVVSHESDFVLIHGNAPGADSLADAWGLSRRAYVDYPAQWQRLGRAAGPLRNQKMIDEWRPDLVVAFPGGSGTADMVKRAHAAGIPVRMVTE